MLTHEMRMYAESCRSMLLQGYAMKGNGWGHELAARTAWEVGQVVADVHGRAQAVKLLDAVADSINSMGMTSPTVELEARPPVPIPAGMMMVAMPRCDADVEAVMNLFGGMKGSWGP